MPAFDVDGAGPAGEPELGDDIGSVGVAESRRADEDESFRAEYVMLLDHIPADRRIGTAL